MKHVTYGKLAFLGAFLLAGCYSYASQDINNGTYNLVQATPDFAVIRVGDSDQVLVRLVNAANNGAVTSFNVGGIGSGIAVHYQAGYRPIESATADTLVPTTDKDQQQYYIVGVTPGQYTFTLTPTSVNTGISATVNVVVTPHDLGAALSKHTVTSGDTITVTAPPGTVFSQTSVVTIAGGTATVLSVAPDSSSLTFSVASTVPVGLAAPISVSKVGVIASPATQTTTIVTTDSIFAPALVPPTLNTNGAALAGDTVILTLPSYEKFSATSAVTFASGAASPIVVRQPQLLKVLVGPGDSGSATVTNINISTSTALGAFSMTSAASLSKIPVFTIAMDKTTANPGDIVTFTGGPHEVFSHKSVITFTAGPAAPIVSLSADSTVLQVIVGPGINGKATVTNIGVAGAGDSVLGVFSATTTTTLVTPALNVAPTTVSNLTPDAGQSFTVTLGGGLRFTSTSNVYIGTSEAGIVSVSADSTTATVEGLTSSSGTVNYKGIVLSYLTTVPLTVNGDKTVTVSSTFAGTADASAASAATAPTVTLTGGQALMVMNSAAPGNCSASIAAAFGATKCMYYKVALTKAAMTGVIKWNTATNPDMGVIIASADGSTCVATLADNQGQIAGNVGDQGNLTTCADNGTATTLSAAGNYQLVILNFDYTGVPWPAWIQVLISQP